MRRHLPLAVIPDVHLQRQHPVRLLILDLHVDEAAQYGRVAIYLILVSLSVNDS